VAGIDNDNGTACTAQHERSPEARKAAANDEDVKYVLVGD
jgi:hypothetical protein